LPISRFIQREFIKSLLVTVITSLGVIVTAGSLAASVPAIWICDMISQFTLAYAIILLILLVALLLLRSKIGAAIVLVGAIVSAVPVVGMYIKDGCTADKEAQTIGILNFNTEFQHNDRYDLLAKLVDDRNPDIFALVEINKKWIDAIEPTTRRFPYSKIFIVGPGMALFSKFPIEKCEVRYFGKSHHPRILATILVQGRPLQIVIAHPTTPKSETGFIERNQEMSLIHDEIQASPSPKVLIGDLNCGPWSQAFKNLLTAGLQDSEQGFGPQPSWPARNGRVQEGLPVPPFVPIDHILVSRDICVQSRVAGPGMESDHLPVFVKATLPK